METISPHLSVSLIKSLSSLLVSKMPIDKAEWEGYFDESGHLVKSRDFISSNILDRGLDPAVRSEAWKFLTGYYSWRSSHDERLTVDSIKRYGSICLQCPSISGSRRYTGEADEYQQGFHEMLLLFQLLVEKEHEVYWLFQFFLQKTEHSCVVNIGVGKNLIMLKAVIAFMDPIFAKHLEGKSRVVQSLFPWFCLFFQQVFKSFDDVWRLWEVFLMGMPCRNFQVIVAYTMLQSVRDQILRENMGGDDILMVCGNIIDLDADELISKACSMYKLLMEHKDKVTDRDLCCRNGRAGRIISSVSHPAPFLHRSQMS
uniref:TBC1 domain family member 21 n=1 Tax=Chrysemys picta bellii TaxID=8478 RepID=A0A8C3FSL0_CHRPI